MTTMSFRAVTDHRHAQALSPRFQHAVRLLQMSSTDFAATVRDVMGRNPFLEPAESDESGEDEVSNETQAETSSADGADRASDAELVYRDDGPLEIGTIGPGAGAGQGSEDGSLGELDTMPVEESLSAHLHSQLNVLPLEWRDLVLARAIVESLDDDGYLRTPLAELLGVVPLEPPASLEEMTIALRRVQALEPAGVAARDVGECLLLQLPAIDCPQMRALVRRIVKNHLDLLAARDVNRLARLLDTSVERIQAACERIRRLDPRPGWRFGSSRIAYIVPDVIVRKVRGRWQVQLNPAAVPKVRLNRTYAELFQRHRSKSHRELAGHLQEAQWTLRNLEQRFSTIVDVAAAIVRRQQHFLEFGSMAMKPLGLREIADELGIHESTVSRVTNKKYIATPIGVFELKHFFSRAMISANGSACSGTAIRSLIGEMIEAERPDAPLSDAEITRQLAQQGLIVARRTVTKYRQMLRIESVERRRALQPVPGAALPPARAA